MPDKTKPNRTANREAGFDEFQREDGTEHGSFEVFWYDWEDISIPAKLWMTTDGKTLPSGWYWWACFPGCLPDGEPSGPFITSTQAFNDAREERE